MSDFSKTTNFTAKDSLASGDPNKVIKGSEHDTEYDNIATASATKADKVTSATDHNLLMMDASGNLEDSTIATNGTGTITATFVGNITGNVTGNLTGNVTSTGSNSMDTLTVTSSLTIPASSIDTAEIATDAVTADEINTTAEAASSTSLSASGGTWTPASEGWYILSSDISSGFVYVQVYSNSTWKNKFDLGTANGDLVFMVSGVTRVINNQATTRTLYYQKVAG